MELLSQWVPRLLPPFAKRPYFFDVLKTFCGEVAVLVLVFPALDWYLEVKDPLERARDVNVVEWSPLIAVVFFALAVCSAWLEESRKKLEK